MEKKLLKVSNKTHDFRHENGKNFYRVYNEDYDENGEIVTTFPRPVGHYQIDGDYHASWQPAGISERAEREVYHITKHITDVLNGLSLFGVEMFVKDNKVWANKRNPPSR